MRVILSLVLLAAATNAFGHLTYPVSRNFGTFGLEPRYITIAGQTTKSFGWADGTDADFARQDDQRYFQFTLESTASITVLITALDFNNLLPAFSIYSGLGHAATDSANPDYDGAAITQQYLLSLGAPTREGAFDALHTWKIANDPATTFDDLVTLTYIGHAADGTSDNYGAALGINGDGVADGFITATFELPAGPYTLVVGGANYASIDTTNRGFTAAVTNIPEPSGVMLIVAGLGMLGLARRRSAAARAI